MTKRISTVLFDKLYYMYVLSLGIVALSCVFMGVSHRNHH